MQLKKLTAALAFASLTVSGAALATNGMNLEGYGPIALGMGGASMAYDNGTAAVMNNPATLGLMANGNRLDVALGFLGPEINSRMTGMPEAGSGGDAYLMPAIGWVKKDNKLTYGVGVFAQGGMGTEYGASSFLAMGSGQDVRSQLGVGRVIVPLAYEINPNLTIAASADFVWAGLDFKMAAPGAQLGSMVSGMPTGNLGMALPALMSAPWARVDFSDSSDYTGKAKTTGWAGKLGFVFKASPALTIGGTYHSKTSLDDMETSTNGASMSAPGFADKGKLYVRDFQWPETYGLGIAYQATPNLMVAADIKHIGWADAMKSMKMSYVSNGIGGSVNFNVPMNWKDQTVGEIGVAYKATDAFVIRAGVNLADNPVPSSTMNPLFPATVANAYTLGMGYSFSKTSEFNAAVSITPEVSQLNAGGVTVEHSQTSWQLMYTQRF